MADEISHQYELYPYPERDPADETHRLIEGSPSHPAEIDHYLFAGKRDWSQPFRVLVAGGGTGDSLIMLATKLEAAKVPAEIIYLDLSTASRKIAEARANTRKLSSIEFRQGDLLSAPELGQFDYIDCCGVLHHLERPQEGFNALAGALKPDGGLGGMVYAPYGRTGVYPLQEAFRQLFANDDPQTKLQLAKKTLASLPETNWFKCNPFVGDHETGDAGFYDLLLHSQDHAFSVEELAGTLDTAGLRLVSFIEPILYDPQQYLPDSPEFRERVDTLTPITKAALAERLSGAIKTHVFYACPKERKATTVSPTDMRLCPRLYGAPAQVLAGQVAAKGKLTAKINGVSYTVQIPKASARLISLINGRPLAEIAAAAGEPPLSFNQAWLPVHHGLTGLNVLRYSSRF